MIGVDPAWRRMEKVSNRAMSKPAKGGLGNLLLINSAVEEHAAAVARARRRGLGADAVGPPAARSRHR